MRRTIGIGILSTLALLAFSAASTDARAEKTRILVVESYAEGLAHLSEQYPDLEIVTAATGEEMIAKVGDCVAVVGISPGHPTGEIVKAGKNLRWMQTMSAGLENYLSAPELRESDIVLTSAKIIQGPEIADHAFGLLLNLTRDMKGFNEQMETGFRRRSRLPLIELRGKTMLILGLGGIGTQVAQRAAAFEMRVLAIDPKDIPIMRDVERVGKPDELDAMIPEADVIVSCAPHTRATEGMLGKKQFALMKDGVYVINVSRGAIIDTEALTEALRSGKVAAAGLDVTDPEPLPPEHPLWKMENVTITPHLATISDRMNERRIKLFADNIERFLKGMPMRNVVSKERGY